MRTPGRRALPQRPVRPVGVNARNLRADQVDIPRECPRPAAAPSAGSGQTATSSLSCCKNLPAGRNVVPALLLQRQLRDDVAVKSQGLRQQRDDVVVTGPPGPPGPPGPIMAANS